MKQVLQLILFTLDTSFLMVSIATRVWEKRSQFFPFNAERQAREALVPFFTSVVWRGQDHTRSGCSTTSLSRQSNIYSLLLYCVLSGLTHSVVRQISTLIHSGFIIMNSYFAIFPPTPIVNRDNTWFLHLYYMYIHHNLQKPWVTTYVIAGTFLCFGSFTSGKTLRIVKWFQYPCYDIDCYSWKLLCYMFV